MTGLPSPVLVDLASGGFDFVHVLPLVLVALAVIAVLLLTRPPNDRP